MGDIKDDLKTLKVKMKAMEDDLWTLKMASIKNSLTAILRMKDTEHEPMREDSQRIMDSMFVITLLSSLILQ